MPRLNTNCVVCEGKFVNSDTIHSTYCGHIFHKICLDNWKLWKACCPMCQEEFPTEKFEFQIFLELDDEEEKSDYNENVIVAKAKGQCEKKENPRLQDQIRELKLICRRLQEEFTISEQSKEEIKQELKQLKESIQVSLEDNTKNFDKKNTKQNTKSLVTVDNNNVSSENDLNKEIRILENKVKYLSDELEKEIAINTSFYIEKFKRVYRLNVETDNYLIIEDLPIHHVKHPFKDTIIDLGIKMNLTVLPEDICKVRMLEKKECRHNSDNVIALLVEFKSNYMKIKFLANRVLLNNYLTTTYTIKPIGDDVVSIYLYANEKLRNCGSFADLYIDGHYVHVKHNEGGMFMVKTAMAVDDLLQRHIQETTVNAAIAAKKIANA